MPEDNGCPPQSPFRFPWKVPNSWSQTSLVELSGSQNKMTWTVCERNIRKECWRAGEGNWWEGGGQGSLEFIICVWTRQRENMMAVITNMALETILRATVRGNMCFPFSKRMSDRKSISDLLWEYEITVRDRFWAWMGIFCDFEQKEVYLLRIIHESEKNPWKGFKFCPIVFGFHGFIHRQLKKKEFVHHSLQSINVMA